MLKLALNSGFVAVNYSDSMDRQSSPCQDESALASHLSQPPAVLPSYKFPPPGYEFETQSPLTILCDSVAIFAH